MKSLGYRFQVEGCRLNEQQQRIIKRRNLQLATWNLQPAK